MLGDNYICGLNFYSIFTTRIWLWLILVKGFWKNQQFTFLFSKNFWESPEKVFGQKVKKNLVIHEENENELKLIYKSHKKWPWEGILWRNLIWISLLKNVLILCEELLIVVFSKATWSGLLKVKNEF